TDPKGNVISVVSVTSDGKTAEMQRTDSSSGVTESYVYTYLAAPDLNAGLLANVTLRRQLNGGSWTTVRQVAYDYYDGTSQKPYGNLGSDHQLRARGLPAQQQGICGIGQVQG